MKSINEDIKKNEYKHAYLLYGSEDYLRNQYKKKLCKALMPEEDSMNISYFIGKDIREGEIIDLGETMPFFSERRVIVMEDTGLFKSAADKLPDYVKELPDYLYFVFVESEIDKRNRMYKAVNAVGRVSEFSKQDERTLLKWVAGILGREGRRITQQDVEYFLTKSGTDMGNISKETEKLVCYTMGRDVVTRADIDAVCTTQIENKVFEMIRMVTGKQQQKALELYYDLLALKEPPMRILYNIGRQFNQLLQIKELAGHGYDQNGMAGKMKLQGFIVRNLQNLARQYSTEELRQAVEDVTGMEEDVKMGRLSDVLSVELLIVKYSGTSKK